MRYELWDIEKLTNKTAKLTKNEITRLHTVWGKGVIFSPHITFSVGHPEVGESFRSACNTS